LSHAVTPALTERALRQSLRHSLAAWCGHVLRESGQAPARHHLYLIDALQDLADGRTTRLIVLMPPGAAKSTYTSLLFPPWWMSGHRDGAVICASNTRGMAEHFGRGVRRLITEHGGRLDVGLQADDRAAGRFSTQAGGIYFATGVHGAVAGRRADLLIIDDPIRSFAESENPRARETLWDWYRADLVTRLKPGGSVVLVMTRWHADDLAGRLMEKGGWRVVRLPALAEEGDPLGRVLDEALWPEWEELSALRGKQAELGERAFSALFQQAPVLPGGALFDITRLIVTDVISPGVSVRAWDLAATGAGSGDPDWTVGLKLTRCDNGTYHVADIRRGRGGPHEVASWLLETAEADGPEVTIGLPRDPGQAAVYQVQALTRMLAGYKVVASPEQGAKAIRAMAVASQVAAGNVSVQRAAWTRAFLEEISIFPNGRKDDQVDALSRAFSLLTQMRPKAGFTHMPFFER